MLLNSKSILKILLLKEMKLFLATTNQMQYTFTKMVKKEVHLMDWILNMFKIQSIKWTSFFTIFVKVYCIWFVVAKNNFISFNKRIFKILFELSNMFWSRFSSCCIFDLLKFTLFKKKRFQPNVFFHHIDIFVYKPHWRIECLFWTNLRIVIYFIYKR